MNKQNIAYHNLIADFDKKISFWQSVTDDDIQIIGNSELRNPPKENVSYIIVGDNPGKEEAAKGQYLIGPAGRICRTFFAEHNLTDNFKSEVIILNKMPIHTPRTNNLRKYQKRYQELFIESQQYMAELVFKIHQLWPDSHLWIIGHSQLDQLFAPFTKRIKSQYQSSLLRDKLFIYSHFSMNVFTTQFKLANYMSEEENVNAVLEKLGRYKRASIMGW